MYRWYTAVRSGDDKFGQSGGGCMLRGLYSAAAGMIAQQRKHDTATGNIANVTTPGYKAENMVMRSFPETLVHIIRDGDGMRGAGKQAGSIGGMHTGVFAEENVPLFLQGDLANTGLVTDLAIVSNIAVPGLAFDGAGRAMNDAGDVVWQPQAFFTVEGPGGAEAYTRDGKFTVDDEGNWVTSSGYRLLDRDGAPIQLDVNLDNVQIAPDGSLIDRMTGGPLTDQFDTPYLDANGDPIRVRVSVIENPYELLRHGNSVFVLGEGGAQARLLNLGDPNDNVQVLQGHMERSNVDPTAATIDMMTALRAYEANQRIIQFYDRTLEKAANEIGRV